MISILHLLSYVGVIAGFLFVTLSLASGLLWLAELIEEHSKVAKVIGIRAIYVVIVLQVLLYFADSLPLLPTLFSIAAHLLYLRNFTPSWPFISLTSPTFLLSCCMVVADHFIWFFHFAEKAQEAKRRNRVSTRFNSNSNSRGSRGSVNSVVAPNFMDVAAFFAICVWMVPLFLFLSLSANDNVLPSLVPGSAPPTPSGGNTIDLSAPMTPGSMNFNGHPSPSSSSIPHVSLVKTILSPLLSVLPRLRGGPSRRRVRTNDEGLIAPRTPMKGSPLPSPGLFAHQSQAYSPWGGPTPQPGEDHASTGSYFAGPMPSPVAGGGGGVGVGVGITPDRPYSNSPTFANAIQINQNQNHPRPPPPKKRFTNDIIHTISSNVTESSTGSTGGRNSLEAPSAGGVTVVAASSRSTSGSVSPGPGGVGVGVMRRTASAVWTDSTRAKTKDD